jgi:hypothetical protein
VAGTTDIRGGAELALGRDRDVPAEGSPPSRAALGGLDCVAGRPVSEPRTCRPAYADSGSHASPRRGRLGVDRGGGSGGERPLRLDLRYARRHLPCCDGLSGRILPGWELSGPVTAGGYSAIVRIYFGSSPTRRMVAQAQQAVRRLRLPLRR